MSSTTGNRYAQPGTVAEARTALAGKHAVIVAGGTDLLAVPGRPLRGRDVVDLSRVRDLGRIDADPHKVSLGASTVWGDLLSPTLPLPLRGLRDAAIDLGSAAIRQRGTVVGNVCTASPVADSLPALIAHDAHVRITSLDGDREIPVATFVTGPGTTDLRPGELVTALTVPLHDRSRSASIKIGRMPGSAFAVVNASATVRWTPDDRVEHLAVAVGAAAPVATRIAPVEVRLVGTPRGELRRVALQAGDLDCLSPIDDHRASASHRRHLAAIAVQRILHDLSEQAI